MGLLTPSAVIEVYPGDKYRINNEHLTKMAPLVFPVMHRVKQDNHYLFVANRLLWPKFEEFQAYDTLNDIPEHPYISLKENSNGLCVVEVGSLADYMGIPTGDYTGLIDDPLHPMNNINPLPFAAYFKSHDDYYRDQNLVDELWQPLTDGNNSMNTMFVDIPELDPENYTSRIFAKNTCLKRAWEKDYFTSALPFAQKGQEVVLPLSGSASIEFVNDGGSAQLIDPLTGNQIVDASPHGIVGQNGVLKIDDIPTPGTNKAFQVNNASALQARLDTAVGATINAFRKAYKLQEFFERNARIGTRYIEQMLGKFGVRISDERAHRAEYVGGTSTPILFSEILQTSETETTPLGQQGGNGLAVNHDFAVNYYCEEHGWIICISSILPETNYSQGLHKKFYKKDILDYYDPKFANLGEQAVKNHELYAKTDLANSIATFGYQSRYAELKYNLGEIHGEFRTELKPWHMAREFSSLPMLNASFVQSDPTHDIFADTDPTSQKVYCSMHHRIIASRKIPYFSTPLQLGN